MPLPAAAVLPLNVAGLALVQVGVPPISGLEAYFQAVTLDPALTLAATNGVRVQNDY